MRKSTIDRIHPFTVWFSEKANRWCTYIVTKDNGRRMIARKNQDDLYQVLAEHYKVLDAAKRHTLESLYPEWLQYKALHTRATATIKHHQYDWQKYYEGTEIVSIPVTDLTRLKLDEWIHGLIKREQLTVKQYANIASIIRQVLDYAVDRDIIEVNPFKAVNVQRKLLITPLKKDADTQVYIGGELDLLLGEARKDYDITGDTSSLAIILCAKTGIRIGECMALKASDLSKGYLHIRREEVLDTPLLPDGSFGPRTYTVVEHTKTDAGLRDIPAVQEVTELITEVRKANLKRCSTSDYLFIKKDGSKMHAKSVDRKIRTLCTRAGINPRSAHKLRKTFISTLIDAGMNIDTVRRIAGHKDESVTLSNYCFDRSTPEAIRNQLEKALG